MALLGISARLVDGTRGRVGEEGWKGRVVEKIAFQVRILSSSPFLCHLSRCTRPTLHQELSFDVFGYVFFSFLSEVAAFKLHGLAGERRRPFSGFIAVRGNVGIIRVQVVQQLRCVIMVKGETDSFLGIPWILCIINVGMSTQFCNTYIYILSVLSKLEISLDRERIWWKEL